MGKKGYNPNQPRWPGGSDVGGEWKGGSGAAADRFYKNKSVPEPTIMPEPVTKPVKLASPGASLDGKYSRVRVRTVTGSRDSGFGRIPTQYLHIMGSPVGGGPEKTLLRGKGDQETSDKFFKLTGQVVDYTYGALGGSVRLPPPTQMPKPVAKPVKLKSPLDRSAHPKKRSDRTEGRYG